MAKYRKGILGSFSGKVGNVVGGTWNGIDYMRSIPNNRKDPKTDAQMAQRERFKLVNVFLQKIKPVVNTGFMTGKKRMTALNRASSYNIKNAISGEYPEQKINFEALMISRGDLIPPRDSLAESTTPIQVDFSWSDNSGVGSAKADDRALILAYNTTKDRAIFIAEDGPQRQDGQYALEVPAGYGGDSMETYLAFVSADGTTSSDSEYLGTVAVTESP